jgi:hypothetical protein
MRVEPEAGERDASACIRRHSFRPGLRDDGAGVMWQPLSFNTLCTLVSRVTCHPMTWRALSASALGVGVGIEGRLPHVRGGPGRHPALLVGRAWQTVLAMY